MPVFHVRSPDGHVHAVTAPEGATEAQAINYVRSRMPKAAAPAPPKRTWSDTFRDMRYVARHAAGSVVNGVTGSWADEVAGAGGALRNSLGAAVGMNKFEPGAAYTREKHLFEQEQRQWERDHHTAHVVGTGAGMAASIVLPEFRAARAAQAAGGVVKATRLARIGRAARSGAIYGAVAGAGKGEGSDRIRNAADGAMFGAGLGAAAHPVVHVASRVGRNIVNTAAPHISSAFARSRALTAAQREVGNALEDAHLSPDDVAAQAHAAHGNGVPFMPADVADGPRQLAGYASRGIGPAQQAVREAIEKRQGNMAQRVRGHIDEALGPTTNPHIQSADLTEQARVASKPLYEEAYQSPVTVTPKLREFLDSPLGPNSIEAGANSIRQTPAAARNLGSEQPFKAGHIWDPNLQAYRSGQAPVLETWDGAKRALDDIEFAQNSQFLPNPSGMTRDVRPVDLSRRQLISELDNQVPKYAEARKAYAGPIQDRRAFEVGNETVPGSARSTSNDARAQMDGMSDSQLAQFRLGDRTNLADHVYGNKSGVRRWGDATNPINGNDARLDLVRTIHGDDAANKLIERIDPERQGHLTYKEVFGNSSTQNRRSVDTDMDHGPALAAVGHLAAGNPLGAAWHVLKDAGAGRGLGRFNQDLKGELGTLLTDQNPASIQDRMAGVKARMAKDVSSRDRLGRFTKAGTRGLAINTVGHSGDDTGIYDEN